MSKIVNIFFFVGVVSCFASCTPNSHEVDISGIASDVNIKRFEKDLATSLREGSITDLTSLRKQYGSFFDMFTFQVLTIPQGNDSSVAANLNLFVSDSEIREIYNKVDSVFNDFEDVKKGIDLFLRHYQYYYPEKVVPEVVTYVSAFNYAVIATDSVIGIGLDMFLGEESEFYPRLGIPKYMSEKFKREYILPSVIKGWFQSDHEQSEVKKEFLSQMIYQGKMQYYLDVMAPLLHDTLKTGYSEKQLLWCRENESRIWSFFIEKKLLFSSDASEYSKFINEGPASSGFSPDAPGKLGAYMGWQIVQAYMKENKDIKLDALITEQDALKILEKSGYKPKR